MGILAAIAIPRFSGVQDKARIKSDKATAAIIGNAVLVYNADNDKSLTNVPTPKELADAGLLTQSTLKVQNNTGVNKGFHVAVANGQPTVSYSSTAITDASWGTLISTAVLYPEP